MSVVVAMPKEMHQGASQQKEVWQDTDDRLKMLTREERHAEGEDAYHREANKAPPVISEFEHTNPLLMHAILGRREGAILDRGQITFRLDSDPAKPERIADDTHR